MVSTDRSGSANNHDWQDSPSAFGRYQGREGALTVRIEFTHDDCVQAEIVHHYSDELLVASSHRKVFIHGSSCGTSVITLPRTPVDLLGWSRLLRRALRLDKCNVFPLDEQGKSMLIIRQGVVFKYHRDKGFRQTLLLRQCRNLLHTDFCKMKSGRLIFGEYGANSQLHPVPIYASDDDGETWEIIHEIDAGKARHIHGVYADKFHNKVWIFTGDANGECWVIEASEDFSDVRYLGDGGQHYRACTVFFTPDKVIWVMDSPLQPSQTVHLDRYTREIELHAFFPGPVWYGLEIAGFGYLVASTVEPGDAVVSHEAAIFSSTDLISWSRLASFAKDRWPMGLFKFGVIGFSRGARSDGAFFVFGEALKKLDGRSLRCEIKL